VVQVTSESTKAPQIANFTKNLILNYGKEELHKPASNRWNDGGFGEIQSRAPAR
jgi:hypothetical protein